MADSTLLQRHTIIENKSLTPQIHRRRRITEPQPPLVCLASFSQNSTSISYTRQPTKPCGYSPVTSGTSSSSSSSSRASQLVTLPGTRRLFSHNIPANSSRVDQILRNLSNSRQHSANDGLELARLLPNEAPVPTTTLLRATKCLCYAGSIEERCAGYKLVESICHTQDPLSAVEAVSLWGIIKRAGLEAEAVARDAQLEALGAWVSRHCIVWRVCGAVDLILSWHEATLQSQSMGVKTFNQLHQILRIIIKSEANVIESHMAKLFQLYRSAIRRALDTSNNTSSILQPDPSSITTPEDGIDKSSHLSEHFSLEDAGFGLLELLEDTRCEVLTTASIPIVMASLCQILGYIPQGYPTSLSASAMREVQSILVHEAYGQLAIETLENIWAPEGEAYDYRVAVGALGVAKQVIIDCLSERIGYNAPLAEPSKRGPKTSTEVDRMIQALIKLPDTWMARKGGDYVLVKLVDLVEQVMTQFRYEHGSGIPTFVGHVILGLTGGLDLYWHTRRHTYKLSILEHSAAPTPIIAALEKLLRSAQNDALMQPPLNYILLSRTQHLTDGFLHDLILQLQRSGQLEPSEAAWKWQDNILTLLGHFSMASAEYPYACRAFVEHLSNVYLHDVYAEVFHAGIAGDIITTLETILPEETDEIVIKAGFDICLKELILSHEHEEIPSRIRAIWMKLALEDHPSSFRRVLAVKFFIIGFKKFAFRPPQSLKIVDGNDDWRQSPSAAGIAISLYRDIVTLAGLSRDDEGQVQGPLLLCPEARLVILQWLLRLRAGATHRIFAVGGPLAEVMPLATLAHRVQDGNEQSIQVPLEKEFPVTSPPAKKRNRTRRTTGSSTSARTGSVVLDMIIDQAVQLMSPQEREAETVDVNPPTPATESSPITVEPSTRQLWSLPDRVRADLFVGTDIPSPAMLTFQANEQSGYWLHVDNYVATLVDILEYDDNWEIVSYVLCHLPLQLANKHFWCGPKVTAIIKHLPIAVCKGLKNNHLWKRLSGTMDIGPEYVQAMLYHTLMVLIAYRKRFSQSDDMTRKIVEDIIDSFMQGLDATPTTTQLSLEGLSLIVYAMPEVLKKFATTIVEKISRIMTNPDLAIPILEFILVLGFARKTWFGNFRPIDHQTVFGIALMYIDQHYKSDGKIFHNMERKVAFSLSQHILHTAFAVIHAWFLRIKTEDRAQYIPFISGKLVAANRKKEVLEPMIVVSLDFLSRYAYANVDSNRSFSFMYKSIICPDVPDDWQSLRKPWRARQAYEAKNVAKVQAFKFGPSIITVSVMKEPKDWIRLVLRRPSCHIEMLCRLEGNTSSAPELELGREANFTERTLDINETFVESLVRGLFSAKDLDRPDPVSGLSWTMDGVSSPEQHVINPAILTPLLASFSGDPSAQLQKFPDYGQLVSLLELLDSTPVTETYKAAVLYVAPGQTEESEILANRHGSPAYTRFMKYLGRVVKTRDELQAYSGGLQADKHGEYGAAWWDDICQVLYHVATSMPNFDVPNMSKTFWKKAEIGNIAVKIIWNDSGKPFKRETIQGDFNFFNIIIEPHTMTPEAAYQKDFHIQGFFKVLLQSDPSLPRITPTGEFKIVAIDDLPQTIGNFAWIACLFCRAWTDTIVGDSTIPLNTNWQQRLQYINKLSRFLSNESETEYTPHGLPVSVRDMD